MNLGKKGQFEFTGLTIHAGEDVAFAHAILLVRGAKEKKAGFVRLTVGFRKIAGTWLVTHEHHSAH